ncbi:MAG: RNA polymerase sigma factor [Solirubrobacterales bacterium]
MALARRGERAPFAALYGRYWPRAVKMATVVCGSRAQAKDIVRVSFGEAWRTRDEYQADQGTVHSWLLGIVRDQAAYARTGAVQWGREMFVEEEDEKFRDELEPEEDMDISSDVSGAIAILLADSPVEQREVVAMSFFGELSPQEIARHLNMPEATVAGRIRLGMEELRAREFNVVKK